MFVLLHKLNRAEFEYIPKKKQHTQQQQQNTYRKNQKDEKKNHVVRSTKQNEHKQNVIQELEKGRRTKNRLNTEFRGIHVSNGRRPQVIYYHEVAIRELQNKPKHYSFFFRFFLLFFFAGLSIIKPRFARLHQLRLHLLRLLLRISV